MNRQVKAGPGRRRSVRKEGARRAAWGVIGDGDGADGDAMYPPFNPGQGTCTCTRLTPGK